MPSSFFDVGGAPVLPENLRIFKARDLALKLQANRIDFARMVECRAFAHAETVVFDVDVEVSQIRHHPIRHVERISVTFLEFDNAMPWIQALRNDFPLVPHLNLHLQEFPRSLCLYEERYEELQRRWTSARFVQHIRSWLSQTAHGELHQKDQPLEAILPDDKKNIVLPQEVLSLTEGPIRLYVYRASEENSSNFFLVAYSRPASATGTTLDILASVHRIPPRTHGIIHQLPQSLSELDTLIKTADFDLLAELRCRLKEWHSDKTILSARLLIVLLIPMCRDDNSAPERVEAWAFYLGDIAPGDDGFHDLRIRNLGQKIGIWDFSGKEIGILLPPDTAKCGDDVAVEVLNVSFELTRSAAAFLNGDEKPFASNIAAVGVGALGSQIVLNLARSGFGKWTLIDHDHLMSHNVARHALDGRFIGQNKAKALALIANSVVGNEKSFTALALDVLNPGTDSGTLSRSLLEADVILDISTSVAVARKITCDVISEARRVSLFLTLSGQDLVVMVEDKDRKISLDALEMQYYRAVANDTALEGHFEIDERHQRYGQSCRDITSTLPQHLVALHAAISAGALKVMLQATEAVLAVWRSDIRGNVRRVDVPLLPVITQCIGDWKVVTDEGLIGKLSTLRERQLPNETGGVLLGSFDVQRSLLYIVDALPSPPDSEEWPTLYIRGSQGLREAVDRVRENTNGMLEYVGEWHSHPRGACAGASMDDFEVFAWLTALMEIDGLPAVMMIVGDFGHTSCFVGEIKNEENLLQVISQ